MGYVYHGSSTRGLRKLTPHKSTHGNYVYATPNKGLAIIFSKRAGDDMTYSLFRYSKDEPYNLVERVPYAFETMFSNSASIYTLDDKTFKDIKTGFSEVVCQEAVDVISEEYIKQLYSKLVELEKNNLIKIYKYPNRPKSIPSDDSDLIAKEVQVAKMMGFEPNFERLLYLHPQLLEKINQYIVSNNIDSPTFVKEDLITIFNKYLKRQLDNPEKEYFLKSAFCNITSYYSEFASILERQIKNNKLNNFF